MTCYLKIVINNPIYSSTEAILQYFKTFEYYEPPKLDSKSKMIVTDFMKFKGSIEDSSKTAATDPKTETPKLNEGNTRSWSYTCICRPSNKLNYPNK